MAKIIQVRTCKEVSENEVSYSVKYESGFVKEFTIDCKNEKAPKTVESFIKSAENKEINKILGGSTYIFNIYTEKHEETTVVYVHALTQHGTWIWVEFILPVDYTKEDLNNAVRERGLVEYIDPEDEPETAETTPEQPETSEPEHSEDKTTIMKCYAFINSIEFNNRIYLGECATVKKAYIKLVSLFATFSASYVKTISTAYIFDESGNALGVLHRRTSNSFFFTPVEHEHSNSNSKTAETTTEQPETSEPEYSEDKPETAPPFYCQGIDYSEIPFDLRIKEICSKCKHLESCFNSDRSKVLEDKDSLGNCGYNIFGELGECGDRCSLCCKQFESVFEKKTTTSEKTSELLEFLDDGDLPF